MMKDIKLVERKPSERLVKLVDAIPELEISEHGCVESVRGVIYSSNNGGIHYGLNQGNKNPLKNVYRLKESVDECVFYITEESFCDLLEEHLYLVAKEKMEELLPQIQEHLPDAKIIDNNDGLSINNKTIDVVVYSRFKVLSCSAFDDIWEDKENLIVKKPKPWWETQDHYYHCETLLPYTSEFRPEKHAMKKVTRTQVGIYAGISTFKTKKEAQAMCDKLNAVLKGE